MTIDDSVGQILSEMRIVVSTVNKFFELLSTPKEPREWYTVEEVAKMVGKTEYTVRQWCNRGVISATKRAERRGAKALWRISSQELRRYQEEGFLEEDRRRNSERS